MANWKVLGLILGLVFVSGLTACGSKAPPPGETLDVDGARVEFSYAFFSFDGNVIASHNIYMRVLDNLGRTVYGTDVTTNAEGIGRFTNVPAGDYDVEFTYGKFGTCKPEIDLNNLPSGGKVAGDCSF